MRKIANQLVRGKKVLLRVDLNCPMKEGKIIGDTRIAAHAKTVKELAERGARVIILAHQGRKGEDDFSSLEQHAKILHEKVGLDVHYIDDTVGEKAKHAIKNMKDGEILVLDNVRHLPCETDHEDGMGQIVHELSPHVDYFVLDALSIAHRKHSSIVGFTNKLPSFAGDILAGEVEAIDKVRHSKNVTFIFGGSKVEDSFKVMKKWLSEGRTKYVLVGGALAVLLLKAKGIYVGDSNEYLKNANLERFISEAKEMLEKFGERIVLPIDMGVCVKMQRIEMDVGTIKHGELWDIGEKTIKKYLEIINGSTCIVMNGPLGVYELDDFSKGTRLILEGVAKCDSFSLIGGGHTISAIQRFNIDSKYFSYVSLSGKALIEYLCGKDLHALKALDDNERKFSKVG